MKVDVDEIRQALETDVIKREVLEGDRATKAKKKITTAQNKANKERSAETGDAAVVSLSEADCDATK